MDNRKKEQKKSFPDTFNFLPRHENEIEREIGGRGLKTPGIKPLIPSQDPLENH
jgi:hypothetical protein